MTRTKTISILVIGAFAAAAVFGAVAYRAASAAESRVEIPQIASVADYQLEGYAHPGPGRGFPGGTTDEDLANALGITVDELNTARETAYSNALDQAVESGLITQAQADQLRERGTAFPFGGRWNGWLSQNGIDYDALLADALGITPEELQDARTKAFEARIDQAVANGNLTDEQADLMKGQRALYSSESFRSAMKSAFEAAVQQAVEAGVITQSQADLILEKMADSFMGGTGFPGMRDFRIHGDFGGRGWRGDMGDGDAPFMPAPSTPSETPSGGA